MKRLTHAGQRQASVQKRSMIQYLDLGTCFFPPVCLSAVLNNLYTFLYTAAATKHRPEFQFLEGTIFIRCLAFICN